MAVMTVTAQAQIEIVVHRGANALAPENTWPSAEAALKYGAKWIEVDVRKSKDGVLFNLHDETLDRTTNGKGKLADMMAQEVSKLDAGSWFGPEFAGLRVPTIAEMLDSLQGQAYVFFDVKRGTPIPTLVNLVREKGFADKSFFWFGDEAMLREFITLAPEMKIKVNAGDIERLKYWQSVCKPSYVEIAPEKITEKFRKYCRKHGIKVMAACQEDDTSQFQLVIDKKADLVNLDRPEVFLPLMQKAQKKFTLQSDLLKIPADGRTLCTQQLQQAIDALYKKGGGRLVLTKGAYLTGGLMLRSDVELRLEEGATLLGSTNPYDYQPINVSQTSDTRNEIARCDIRSSASAVKFGTASWGGFRKVYVHDIKVSDTFRSAIAIESVDGAQIDSILVERIDAKNTGNPIFMRLGQRAGDRKGSLRNVTIRNLTCQVPFGRPDEAYDLRGPEVDFFHNPFPSSICGIPGNCIEHITLQDIKITYPGRATKGMAYIPLWRKHDVPEQIQKYPEFTMFGELPAWGFYLRHIRNITLKNVQLSLADDDFRPAIVEEDVENMLLLLDR